MTQNFITLELPQKLKGKKEEMIFLCILKKFSLLEDYHFLMFPNSLLSKFIGHKDNVKCVDFVGIQGNYIVSGSRFFLFLN